MSHDHRTLVVGAGLAGAKTCENLRLVGYSGKIVLIGVEADLPYDRPPLSKGYISAQEPPKVGLFPESWFTENSIELRLETEAKGVDLKDQTLHTSAGALAYDNLVIATGSTPVLPPIPGADLDGVFTLRNLSEAKALRARLNSSSHLVVIGAGFIGAEIASSAIDLGLSATLVEAASGPMLRGLGPVLSSHAAGLITQGGAHLMLNTAVSHIRESPNQPDSVGSVTLSDGSEVAADCLVIGVGVRSNVDWLSDSALCIAGAVETDEFLRAKTTDGQILPNVVVVGDAARFDVAGGSMRLEHWNNGVDSARQAARTLTGNLTEPYAPIPHFWSDQFGIKIQVNGDMSVADEVEVLEHDPQTQRLTAVGLREDRVCAVAGFSRQRNVILLASALKDGWSRAKVLEYWRSRDSK